MGRPGYEANCCLCPGPTLLVYLFLTDVFLALLAVIYEGIRLRQGPVISTSYQLHTGVGNRISHEFHLAIHMIQVMLKFYSVCILLYILHPLDHSHDSN